MSAIDSFETVPLDTVLRTEELARRGSRRPDHEGHAKALISLSRALARAPGTILEALCKVAQQQCVAGSAGVSLLSEGGARFHWPAVTGAWHEQVGGGTPRNFGPCGVVLDRRGAQLFIRPERYYPYIQGIEPVIEEVLLAPFYVADQAMGTVWVLSHDPSRHFDAEDQRQLEGLAAFAAGAYQVVQSMGDLEARRVLLQGQKEAFQAAVNGVPLEASLAILVRATVAQYGHQTRCAFYIADGKGKTVSHVVGMSEDYARAVDGFRIGADSFSCGLAIHSGQPVVTPDVRTDARWKSLLAIADKTGFRASWSFPVETAGRKMVGSFALYFREPRDPTDRDYEFAATVTQAAAIIISRHYETQERARVAQALEAADRQKDEFLAMLAHELRNPLAAIGNAGALLNRTVAKDAKGQTAISIVQRQVGQLTHLVDDLLDVSRITRGRIELQLRPLEIAALVTQVIETLEPQLRERRHRLSILTSSYEPIYVRGDAARLAQCVGNVLSNAIKYTDPGGEIRVTTRTEGNEAVIEISDNGSGIASELLPRVFELFVQGDRTLERAQGGLGIGLSLVKRLIELHHGEISAHSDGIGEGATFSIRLPRIERPSLPAARSLAVEGPRRRILIVDDNRDAAQSLAMLLNVQGHETQVAYSSAQVLDVVRQFRPDVCLLDIGLPEVNGYELANQLRGDPQLKGLRIIALTGYGQAEDRARALATGFEAHLVKPVNLEVLERTLHNFEPQRRFDA